MTSSENTDPARIHSEADCVFGIRMTLPENDPFRSVLGADWQSFRWYATAAERDRALEEMRREHRFSRTGDRPALVYEKTERDRPGRALPALRA